MAREATNCKSFSKLSNYSLNIFPSFYRFLTTPPIQKHSPLDNFGKKNMSKSNYARHEEIWRKRGFLKENVVVLKEQWSRLLSFKPAAQNALNWTLSSDYLSPRGRDNNWEKPQGGDTFPEKNHGEGITWEKNHEDGITLEKNHEKGITLEKNHEDGIIFEKKHGEGITIGKNQRPFVFYSKERLMIHTDNILESGKWYQFYIKK